MEKLNHKAQVWVVASGKGGSGKTFVSTSLALTLTKLGSTVTLVDMDTTGANLHTVIGEQPQSFSMRNWLEDKRPLQELITSTDFPRLQFIQGLWDQWSPLEFLPKDAEELSSAIRQIKSDYVIVDLGPGASEAQIKLFQGADEKILVSTPEPTSIEKTYRFIESYMCASLREDARPEAYQQLLKTLREHRHKKIKKHFSFRHYLKHNEGFVFDHFERLSSKPVRLIVNSARSPQHHELGHSMKSVCTKYFDISLDYSGSLDYDNAVWQSVRNREPVLIAQPFSPLAGQFLMICKHIIASEEFRAVG